MCSARGPRQDQPTPHLTPWRRPLYATAQGQATHIAPLPTRPAPTYDRTTHAHYPSTWGWVVWVASMLAVYPFYNFWAFCVGSAAHPRPLPPHPCTLCLFLPTLPRTDLSALPTPLLRPASSELLRFSTADSPKCPSSPFFFFFFIPLLKSQRQLLSTVCPSLSSGSR